MANTVSGSLGINKAAYIKRAYYALRPQKYYDSFVDVQATDTTAVGSSYTWNITSDLSEATTPLGEQTDVTPVAPTDTPVTATPLEYGNAVKLTALAEATAFMSYNPIIANLIGFNAGISTDALGRNAFQVGTNALYSKGSGSAQVSRAALASTNTIDLRSIATGVAKLRGLNVMPVDGSSYGAIIHPDVAVDLRLTSGGASWGDPHVYGAAGAQDDVWNGRVGKIAGATFIESPRAPLFLGGSPGAGAATTNAKTTTTSTASDVNNSVTITTSASHLMSVGQGITFSGNGGVALPLVAVIVSVPSATTFTITAAGVSAGSPSVTVTSGSMSVYRTLLFGMEAFGKAYNPRAGYSTDPSIGSVPVTDNLERFTGVYWKHLVAYIIFRQSALYSVESTSSIGIL